ncbi:uncharacterized protein LOC143449759 [Clavelina lepadiformis]|uniref:uncharacterized protein LOC143449759 n=1 Tax=Clavelina lepadiformis TaxID=159417 RepID=UPI004041D32B
MEGSGFTQGINLKVKGPPERGPIEVIAIISILEILEFFILVFVIRTSWTAEKNTKSICQFLISLSLLKKCFILSAVVILAQNTIFLISILLPLEYDGELCTILVLVTGLTSYNIAMITVYLFLWIKQNHLHSSPVLKSALPRWLPILSKFSLLLTLVAFVLPLVMVLANGSVSCVYRDGYCYTKRSTFPVFPTLMMGASILTQTAYTVLFCVTLKIHEKANKIAANSKTQSSRKITQRCFYFAVAAVLTDCINTVSISATISIIPEVYVNLFPKLDLFINLLCMLFCFNTLPGVMKKIVHMITCGKISFGDEDKVVANHQTARTTVPSISAVVQA